MEDPVKKVLFSMKQSFFISVKIALTEFKNGDNEEEIRIKAVVYGEIFSLDKHP